MVPTVNLFEQTCPFKLDTRSGYLWNAAMWRQRARQHAVKWPVYPDMAQECQEYAWHFYRLAQELKQREFSL